MQDKKYAAHGPGFSGTTDDIKEAHSWLDVNHGNGSVYIRLNYYVEELNNKLKQIDTLQERVRELELQIKGHRAKPLRSLL